MLNILEQTFLMDKALSLCISMSDIRNATPVEHSICASSLSTVHTCELLEFNSIYTFRWAATREKGSLSLQLRKHKLSRFD